MSCAHQDRGIKRFTTLESLRWIAWVRGECSSRYTMPNSEISFFGDRPLTPLSLPLLAPRAVFAALRFGEGSQDRFRSESRDALEGFAIRDAFPRQITHDSA